MKSKRIRRWSAILAGALLYGCAVSAVSAAFSEAVVQKNYEFTDAYVNQDANQIIASGLELIAMLKDQPDSMEKFDWIANKYDIIAKTAEQIGNYELAADCYEGTLPYLKLTGRADGIPYAYGKLAAYRQVFQIYEETPESVFYSGAKFEPRTGAFFGSVYNDGPVQPDSNGIRREKNFEKPESMYLIYYHHGNAIEEEFVEFYLNQARQQGANVLFAWNKTDATGDLSGDATIAPVLKKLGDSGLNIFLRYSAEMNDGPNGQNPEAFRREFIQMAEYARQYPNIAMVWSPIDIGAWNRPFADYYPGDQYVDWVGVSSYQLRYFQGKPDQGEQTDNINAMFMTDTYANPYGRLVPIVAFMRENHINKPLMISEGGVTRYVRTIGEDTTAWGEDQLKKMYHDTIRLFPQLKSICYFNQTMPEEFQDFAIHDSPQLTSVYNQLVKNPYFTPTPYEESGFTYRLFDGGVYDRQDTLLLSAVAHSFGQNPAVLYSIDGYGEIGRSLETPYECEFNLSFLPEGQHTLRAVMTDAAQEKVLASQTFTFTVTNKIEDTEIAVEVNGTPVPFSGQKPVLLSGRTLVPLRGVLEKMGYTVNWEEETQTVQIVGDSELVTVPIGKNRIYSYCDRYPRAIYTDVCARIINGSTMIPLRAVFEEIGAQVDWEESTGTVKISY